MSFIIETGKGINVKQTFTIYEFSCQKHCKKSYPDKFGKYASNCPDVNLGSVLGIAYQKFGGSIPSGGNVIGEYVIRICGTKQK
jgi:hypothetical protein